VGCLHHFRRLRHLAGRLRFELPGPSRTGPANFEILEIPMLSIFRRLMKNAEGATAIEYTLIASLIAVAAIASMRTVGGKVSNVLSNVANSMT
jgi:pilus assembly protein Flp/PilA